MAARETAQKAPPINFVVNGRRVPEQTLRRMIREDVIAGYILCDGKFVQNTER